MSSLQISTLYEGNAALDKGLSAPEVFTAYYATRTDEQLVKALAGQHQNSAYAEQRGRTDLVKMYAVHVAHIKTELAKREEVARG